MPVRPICLALPLLLAALLLAGCAGSRRTADEGGAPYQTGTASYYAHAYHGRPTASGEPFDMHGLTAAHLTLPFGTLVRVTNLKNRRQVVLRINDRGPFVPGRILDVSYAAAYRLGMLNDGLVKVRIDLIDPGYPAGSPRAARR